MVAGSLNVQNAGVIALAPSMQALALLAPGHSALLSIDLPSPSPHEVIVKVEASRLCGSDIKARNGQSRIARYPIVIGHEMAGTVVEVGPGVNGLRLGDRVVGVPYSACRSCRSCLRGDFGGCSDSARIAARLGVDSGGQPRLEAAGQRYYSSLGIGGMADFCVVNQRQLVVLPDEVEMWEAAAVSCGHLTGLSAVWERQAVISIDRMVVVGCGSVGLGAIQAARVLGVETIVAIDRDPAAIDLARNLGATIGRQSATGVDLGSAMTVPELQGDFVLEASGTSSGFATAIASTAQGGFLHCVAGGPLGTSQSVEADWLHGRRTLAGSLMGGGDPATALVTALALIASKQLDVSAVVNLVDGLERVRTSLDDPAARSGAVFAVRQGP